MFRCSIYYLFNELIRTLVDANINLYEKQCKLKTPRNYVSHDWTYFSDLKVVFAADVSNETSPVDDCGIFLRNFITFLFSDILKLTLHGFFFKSSKKAIHLMLPSKFNVTDHFKNR